MKEFKKGDKVIVTNDTTHFHIGRTFYFFGYNIKSHPEYSMNLDPYDKKFPYVICTHVDGKFPYSVVLGIRHYTSLDEVLE